MKSILVTGAAGQLGSEFERLSRSIKDFHFIFTTRTQIDLARPETFETINDLQPDIVINCAAYTAVDQAESERETAMAYNANILADLAQICAAREIPIIHFSSDYVYHNALRRPLRETDPTRPKGAYAKSKLKGEKVLLQHHPNPLIFRVSWLYSSFGHNFPKTILRLIKERDLLNIVNDQIGAPTYASDVARMVVEVSRQMEGLWHEKFGIYNYCNIGTTTWSGIAQHIVDRTGSSCKINPIPSVQYPTLAPRPRYSVLNLSKFKKNFDLPIPHWQDSLDHCLDLLLNEKG
ncbi:MAG: dTDP-4-dehydrorhamnose reductase [Saprospiraceae bacterium]|nr:dTDP-4-dehydrorhamnose reductase [Saprospiraceae bacterium]